MQYWLSITTIPEQDQLLDVARLAEEAGFDGITVADHLLMPTRIESRYPYTEDGAMWWPPDTPWPDPFVTLAAMGAVTTRLRLASNICIAALRDPVTLAKAVSTAAVLSGGRVVLGAAAGWLREEYELLGVDFSTRGRRLDELLAVLRKLWSGQAVEHRGEFFSFDSGIMCPAPPTAVPVWCGGAAPAALARAARNDGWLGLPLDRSAALPMIAGLRRLRAAAALPLETLAINIAFTEAHTPAAIAELEQFGVTGLMILSPWLPNPFFSAPWFDPGANPATLGAKRDALMRFAAQVIHTH
jgi:probable F420-dependent oxidoreductase